MTRPPRHHIVAVGLLAAGGLAYEVALTRLLSALLVSSWVAPVLAVALLGVGLGAGLAAAAPLLRGGAAALLGAAAAAALAVLSFPLWLFAAASGNPWLGLALPLLAYVGIGMSSAAVFARHPPGAAWLSRADYGAAAAAALATPWLLDLTGLGAPAAMIAAAALVALAATALTRSSGFSRPRGPSDLGLAGAAIAVAAPLLGALALAVGAWEVRPSVHMTGKPISLVLAGGGTVESTRWDGTARTDLVRAPSGARYLYMDGGAGSLVPESDPSGWSSDVGAFPFALAPATSAYLIGSGGGLDVVQARSEGVEEVTAVEVNRASVELVRDLGSLAAPVYEPPTEVVIGDGRRELADRRGAYDVITLANVVTGAAELRGAALTENLVYTVEAFEQYLAALTSHGRLALKLYDELTLTRALTTALAALVDGGHAPDHSAALDHVMAVMDVSQSRAVPLLVVRRSPFTREEAVAAARLAERRGWSLLLVPGLLAPPSLQPLARGEADLDGVVAASHTVDLGPTRDDAPYFFSFEPGVPRDARRAGVLAATASLALAASALLAGRRLRGAGSGARGLLAATGLGAGFLLVELASLPLVQRAAGHPTWSLSLTLGAVLVGGAIGAHLAARRTGGVRAGALIAAVSVSAWLIAAPPLIAVLAPLPAWLAGAAAAAMLMAASVPMGLPFPRLLVALGAPRGVAAALALSGLAAVVAGAGALWLSHALGLSAVGWAAAGAYLLAAAAAPARRL